MMMDSRRGHTVETTGKSSKTAPTTLPFHRSSVSSGGAQRPWTPPSPQQPERQPQSQQPEQQPERQQEPQPTTWRTKLVTRRYLARSKRRLHRHTGPSPMRPSHHHHHNDDDKHNDDHHHNDDDDKHNDDHHNDEKGAPKPPKHEPNFLISVVSTSLAPSPSPVTSPLTLTSTNQAPPFGAASTAVPPSPLACSPPLSLRPTHRTTTVPTTTTRIVALASAPLPPLQVKPPSSSSSFSSSSSSSSPSQRQRRPARPPHHHRRRRRRPLSEDSVPNQVHYRQVSSPGKKRSKQRGQKKDDDSNDDDDDDTDSSLSSSPLRQRKGQRRPRPRPRPSNRLAQTQDEPSSSDSEEEEKDGSSSSSLSSCNHHRRLRRQRRHGHHRQQRPPRHQDQRRSNRSATSAPHDEPKDASGNNNNNNSNNNSIDDDDDDDESETYDYTNENDDDDPDDDLDDDKDHDKRHLRNKRSLHAACPAAAAAVAASSCLTLHHHHQHHLHYQEEDLEQDDDDEEEEDSLFKDDELTNKEEQDPSQEHHHAHEKEKQEEKGDKQQTHSTSASATTINQPNGPYNGHVDSNHLPKSDLADIHDDDDDNHHHHDDDDSIFDHLEEDHGEHGDEKKNEDGDDHHDLPEQQHQHPHHAQMPRNHAPPPPPETASTSTPATSVVTGVSTEIVTNRTIDRLLSLDRRHHDYHDDDIFPTKRPMTPSSYHLVHQRISILHHLHSGQPRQQPQGQPFAPPPPPPSSQPSRHPVRYTFTAPPSRARNGSERPSVEDKSLLSNTSDEDTTGMLLPPAIHDGMAGRADTSLLSSSVTTSDEPDDGSASLNTMLTTSSKPQRLGALPLGDDDARPLRLTELGLHRVTDGRLEQFVEKQKSTSIAKHHQHPFSGNKGNVGITSLATVADDSIPAAKSVSSSTGVEIDEVPHHHHHHHHPLGSSVAHLAALLERQQAMRQPTNHHVPVVAPPRNRLPATFAPAFLHRPESDCASRDQPLPPSSRPHMPSQVTYPHSTLSDRHERSKAPDQPIQQPMQPPESAISKLTRSAGRARRTQQQASDALLLPDLGKKAPTQQATLPNIKQNNDNRSTIQTRKFSVSATKQSMVSPAVKSGPVARITPDHKGDVDPDDPDELWSPPTIVRQFHHNDSLDPIFCPSPASSSYPNVTPRPSSSSEPLSPHCTDSTSTSRLAAPLNWISPLSGDTLNAVLLASDTYTQNVQQPPLPLQQQLNVVPPRNSCPVDQRQVGRPSKDGSISSDSLFHFENRPSSSDESKAADSLNNQLIAQDDSSLSDPQNVSLSRRANSQANVRRQEPHPIASVRQQQPQMPINMDTQQDKQRQTGAGPCRSGQSFQRIPDGSGQQPHASSSKHPLGQEQAIPTVMKSPTLKQTQAIPAPLNIHGPIRHFVPPAYGRQHTSVRKPTPQDETIGAKAQSQANQNVVPATRRPRQHDTSDETDGGPCLRQPAASCSTKGDLGDHCASVLFPNQTGLESWPTQAQCVSNKGTWKQNGKTPQRIKFLAALSVFEKAPSASNLCLPQQDDSEEEKTAFGKSPVRKENRSLDEHFSKESDHLSVDRRSIDVRSVKSALESSQQHSRVNKEHEEHGDDSSSIKSLREKYEKTPKKVSQCEDAYKKARSVFETNKRPAGPRRAQSFKEKASNYQSSKAKPASLQSSQNSEDKEIDVDACPCGASQVATNTVQDRIKAFSEAMSRSTSPVGFQRRRHSFAPSSNGVDKKKVRSMPVYGQSQTGLIGQSCTPVKMAYPKQIKDHFAPDQVTRKSVADSAPPVQQVKQINRMTQTWHGRRPEQSSLPGSLHVFHNCAVKHKTGAEPVAILNDPKSAEINDSAENNVSDNTFAKTSLWTMPKVRGTQNDSIFQETEAGQGKDFTSSSWEKDNLINSQNEGLMAGTTKLFVAGNAASHSLIQQNSSPSTSNRCSTKSFIDAADAHSHPSFPYSVFSPPRLRQAIDHDNNKAGADRSGGWEGAALVKPVAVKPIPIHHFMKPPPINPFVMGDEISSRSGQSTSASASELDHVSESLKWNESFLLQKTSLQEECRPSVVPFLFVDDDSNDKECGLLSPTILLNQFNSARRKDGLDPVASMKRIGGRTQNGADLHLCQSAEMAGRAITSDGSPAVAPPIIRTDDVASLHKDGTLPTNLPMRNAEKKLHAVADSDRNLPSEVPNCSDPASASLPSGRLRRTQADVCTEQASAESLDREPHHCLRNQDDAEKDEESCGASGETEFSDGVTLDVSIADVSGLTNPTCLLSKAGDSVSIQSPKSADLIESMAKRSEASSSQTSEAAVPLIAKAMRMIPMSDEVSTNSFFAQRAVIAKHWSKTSGWDIETQKILTQLSSDKQQKDIVPLRNVIATQFKNPDDDSAGWDVDRVESCFPVTQSSLACEIFEFDSPWQGFSAANSDMPQVSFGPDAAETIPPGVRSTPLSKALPGISKADVYADSSSQRSKTPTRSNKTSRLATRQESKLTPETETSTPGSGSRTTYTVRLRTATEEKQNRPGIATPQTRVFNRTHPNSYSFDLSSPDEKQHNAVGVNEIMKTPSKINSPGEASTSAISPLQQDFQSVMKNTALGRIGVQHSVLMARLRSLKEARLRRAARVGQSLPPSVSSTASSSMFPHNTRRSVNSYDCDEYSHSTRSSTQFGGSTFIASLEVD